MRKNDKLLGYNKSLIFKCLVNDIIMNTAMKYL